MIFLKSVGVSIHLLANIPFAYFTPKVRQVEENAVRENNRFNFGDDIGGLFMNAPTAQQLLNKAVAGGSMRAKQLVAHLKRRQGKPTRRQQKMVRQRKTRVRKGKK
jgi:hypothetical protein